MPKHRAAQKGVVLLIVLATVLIVIILAGIVLNITSSQSRLTHHQVSRIKAYYTGKGMMNYVLEKMRTDSAWAPSATDGENKYACYRGCIDSGVTVTPGLSMPADDADIPYKVQVKIYPTTTSGIANGGKIDIKTDYSYTP